MRFLCPPSKIQTSDTYSSIIRWEPVGASTGFTYLRLFFAIAGICLSASLPHGPTLSHRIQLSETATVNESLRTHQISTGTVETNVRIVFVDPQEEAPDGMYIIASNNPIGSPVSLTLRLNENRNIFNTIILPANSNLTPIGGTMRRPRSVLFLYTIINSEHSETNTAGGPATPVSDAET
ncbi:hypothetical protein PTTG_28348 [Puccinia triticina 1-1 BBBD Race 1]|uniref:Uncharacterized protein n=2 Tax=Puccinia triticina TaxID=208348 RepID=A0A180GD78_PUCT1|nr:uncharacterized protein PtA15_4A757 [Puccinia triticina]OAV90408.1 hypothetical protein PTTG_28348 [Puccinia triticina 1-1 BBBD Race 1]WAQ84304.1 hypothetical protein PtA15_4A757 [Puccinia triticina]WAR55123.1 hypothetical protein PtB15_4B743 [Puccinia triticina]